MQDGVVIGICVAMVAGDCEGPAVVVIAIYITLRVAGIV